MIFIWHRWGILALIIPLPILYLTQLAVDASFGQGFYTATLWPKVIATFATAIAVSGVGFLLNKKHTELNQKHRFFWLPMEYWGAIFLIFGLFVTLK
jgi:predicted ABC-type sugar transport system permease subunit